MSDNQHDQRGQRDPAQPQTDSTNQPSVAAQLAAAEQALALNVKALEQHKKTLSQLLLEKYEPIAIVGVGLRFPGDCDDLTSFTDLLNQGKAGTGPIPKDRWDNDAYHTTERGEIGKIATVGGGFVKQHDAFDAKFFSISPKEAQYMDPQQRLVMEVCWQALENANINPQDLLHSDGGVYMGISSVDYSNLASTLAENTLESQLGTGTAHSAIAGRVSYFLGWRGPSVAIDTACSSSLVAVHQGMVGLRRKECNIALCGGVNVIHHTMNHIVFSRAGMLAPDGMCKTFDDSADGYSRSEGCGVVVLKRLSDALRDNDNVIALLRGSSVRQDGESGGLTVPNGSAQELVMKKAIADAALAPGDINYVEAHGTGTSLGDPIEMRAINQVFGQAYSKAQPLMVGSVKTNIGHMEAAAGMGGLIKVALQLQNHTIYPHIHLTNPSSHIPWDQYPIVIPQQLSPWQHDHKRAIVNSFGFAGTIASVVMEQAPPNSRTFDSQTKAAHLLTLSAKSQASLNQLISRYQALADDPELDLPGVCQTSQLGRAHHQYRLSSAVTSRTDLIDFLDRSSKRLNKDTFKLEQLNSSGQNWQQALLFTGQGAQYIGMGASLYQHYPAFKHVVDACDKAFMGHMGVSIKAIMFGEVADAEQLINQTRYTQPSLFIIEYALAMTLLSWGVKPAILIGHSIGEIAAACVAGLFNLEDACKLVATRAKLMQSVNTAGSMTAVKASQQVVAPFIADYPQLAFAALNAPEQVVISGAIADLTVVHQQLAAANIDYRPLTVSHAFHSPLMTEVFAEFRQIFSEIRFNTPQITLISNLTGEVADVAMLQTADYWVRHIGEPVRFAAGMQAIEKRGPHLFIEVGPSASLTALGKQSVTAQNHRWIPMLDRKVDSVLALNRGLGLCYDHGVPFNWSAVYRGQLVEKVNLPLYPFEKKRYWLPKLPMQTIDAGHPLLGRRLADDVNLPYSAYIASIRPNSPAYLAEHVVMDQVIFPGAGYVEIALALADERFGDSHIRINELTIEEPLILSDEQAVELSTRIYPAQQGQSRFEIVSLHQGHNELIERRHAAGYLCHQPLFADLNPATATGDQTQLTTTLLGQLQDLQQQSPSGEHQAESLYIDFADIGLQYGENFQKIIAAKTYGELQVVAHLHSHASTGAEILNPSILDGAMQSIATLIDDDNTYLPVAFNHFNLFKKPKGATQVCLQLHSKTISEDRTLTADLLLVDDYGPVFLLQGLTLKQAPRSRKVGQSMIHQLNWRHRSLTASDQTIDQTAKALVIQASEGQSHDFGQSVVHATDVAQALTLLQQDQHITSISYIWSNQENSADIDALHSQVAHHYGALLQLTKQLDSEFAARQLSLFLVSQYGQILPQDLCQADGDQRLLAASLWGFGATLLNEHPTWAVTLVDVDDLASLANEWTVIERQDHRVAYRQGQRFVQQIKASSVELDGNDPATANKALTIDEYGQFANLKFKTVERIAPTKGEVQIEVKAAGLNFKDVLNALGMLKEYAEQKGIDYQPLPLGFECAGVVVAAGPDAEFAVGDEVIVSQLGCMQQYITVSCDVVVRKPRSISFEQAAGLATAYVTAYYSLHYLADLKANEKVLIHAAAGGVGQAAIALAQRMNAEIFATASEAKWPLLQSQGVQHIMNSRNLDFATQVATLTQGQGVDVLVNSLNKDFIPKGLDCMADHGRFVELGKIGVWSNDEVAAYRSGLKYDNFDLSELPTADLNALNKEILTVIVELIEAGEINPLPTTTFGIDDIEEAFATLSRGANIGKLVISFDNPTLQQPQAFAVNPEHAVLITGGIGALGIKTASWLAGLGAKHIALMSRRSVSAQQLTDLRQQILAQAANPSQSQHCQIHVLTGDVANAADVQRVFGQISEIAPLGGIIHGAGILADKPISAMTMADIDSVFAAKVYGTWLLHQHSKDLTTVNYFVSYSSIAAMLGSATQGNYSAANAYIDQLMQWRCANGLPGLAIQWGPWADIGMAAQLSPELIRSIEDKGIKFLKPGKGIKLMQQLLTQRADRRAIGGFDWTRYLRQQLLAQSLFSRLSTGELPSNVQFDMALFASLSSAEQQLMVNNLVRSKVANVLMFDSADDIETDARFADLGLDSLVAVELKNALETSFKIPLQTAMLYDYPAIDTLADHLFTKLGGTKLGSQIDGNSLPAPDSPVIPLSDDDIDAELAELADL